MADETNHNTAQEVAPSTVEQQAPSVSEENAPSTDSEQATNIPSANAPDPATANPDVNPNASGEKPTVEAQLSETSSQTSTKKPAASAKDPAEKPAAAKAPKKEKGPAVEDKPFAEFIQQDCLPALKQALEKQGAKDVEINLTKQKIQVSGLEKEPECWQVIGSLQGGKRKFNLYFPDEDIQGQRALSLNVGSKPSTLEPFLIDERKITLDLLVFGLVQRLTGQKWLTRN